MRTVNFLEAVRSGKRFKAVGLAPQDHDLSEDFSTEYLSLIKVIERLNEYSAVGIIKFFNSKFEIEETKVQITESQLDSIVENIRKEYLKCRSCHHFSNRGNCEGCNNLSVETTVVYKNLKEKLGLVQNES
tara:strand:- start:373 stop:765 length:393 start_codon:yes stop_codon:yes gene_type:complete